MTRVVLKAEPVATARQSQGRTLPQLLRDNAGDFGDTAALKSKRAGIWQVRPWNWVYERVKRLARGLAALGLERGEVLALISENVEEQYLLELAALSIGAITVSIYPDATADELAYALTDSRAAMVVGEDQEQVDKIIGCLGAAGHIRRILYVDGRGLWNYAEARLVALETVLDEGSRYRDEAWITGEIANGSARDVAVYCYTSGTTGRPKAAMLSHAFLLDNAHRLLGALDVRPGGNYLSYISPAWAAEQFFGVALPLLAPLVVHFAEKPETVQRDLREVGPEFLMFTPRQWEMQASNIESRMMDAGRLRQGLYAWGVAQGLKRVRGEHGWFGGAVLQPLADLLVLSGIRELLGLSHARAVLSGGSGLSGTLFERFRAFGVPLGNLYGSTELGLISTHRPGSKNPQTMGSLMPSDPTIAEPIEGWIDEGGELRLKVLAFDGYLNGQEEASTLAEREQGYHTGDAVRLDTNGELMFLDRLKDLRKLKGGHTYPPQFIENRLRASSMIREAIVIGDDERDCVVALVNIDAEIAGRFAELRGLAYGTFPELSQLPAIREEVARAIRDVNGLVDPPARIAAFANLPKELDADEAELTRSRKLRREHIHERYAGMIDGLYRGDTTLPTEIEVRYQDGSSSMLRAEVALNRLEAHA
jgi:long-chain acyl-CoA synthetase